MRSEKAGVELPSVRSVACCTHITPHLCCSQEHLWSVWVTFLLSYKSPPEFFQRRQFCYSTSPCMLFRGLGSSWASGPNKGETATQVHTQVHTQVCLIWLKDTQAQGFCTEFYFKKAVQTVCPSPFLLGPSTSRVTAVLKVEQLRDLKKGRMRERKRTAASSPSFSLIMFWRGGCFDLPCPPESHREVGVQCDCCGTC